jgi:hypothetical protein
LAFNHCDAMFFAWSSGSFGRQGPQSDALRRTVIEATADAPNSIDNTTWHCIMQSTKVKRVRFLFFLLRQSTSSSVSERMLELHVLVAVVKQPLVDYLWSNYRSHMTALESRLPGLFMTGQPALDAAAAAGRLLIRDRFHQRRFENYLQSLVRHCPGATTAHDLVDWVLLGAVEHVALRAAGHMDMNGRLNELIHEKCAKEFATFIARLGWWCAAKDAARAAAEPPTPAAAGPAGVNVVVDENEGNNATRRKRYWDLAHPDRRRRRATRQ